MRVYIHKMKSRIKEENRSNKYKSINDKILAFPLQIGVHNQLTYNSLTKQITFTPYYILINNADFLIECQEGDRPADPVIKVR